jgi:hypothetical protein
MQGMAAMKNPSLVLGETPALVRGLPDDMRPAAGQVRRLATGLGSSGFAAYVWPRGTRGGICLVSTTGGGGCLSSFNRPFSVTIADADQLGSGAPATVWGPVADEVASVAVTVDGVTGQATIKNNIAYFELPADALPSDVQKVTVTLRDGRVIPIRV